MITLEGEAICIDVYFVHTEENRLEFPTIELDVFLHSSPSRTGHDSLRRRELRLARVSMSIVILYMVCHAPKLLPSLLELIHGDPKVTL